jgi:hypothetical protein
MALGVAIGRVVLVAIHSHDPWLVVFLIAAAVLAIPATIMCARLAFGLRSRQ